MRLSSNAEYDNESFDSTTEVPNELYEADFTDCTFTGSSLFEKKLRGCRFSDCVFTNVDSSLADFRDSAFRSTTFSGCKLVGINWSQTRVFEMTRWTDCILDDSSFQMMDLRKSQWLRCRVHFSDFSGSNLQLTKLIDCQLDNAEFNNADLRGASFQGSPSLTLNPLSVKLKNTVLEGETVLNMAAELGIKVAGRG